MIQIIKTICLYPIGTSVMGRYFLHQYADHSALPVLRRMRRGDMPCLVEISRENMSHIIRSAWGMEWRDELLIDTLLDDENLTEVLELGEGIIAYYSICKKKGSMFVNSIQVLPWMQRRGLGKVLMDRIESLAKLNGLGTVELWVQSTNDPAMGFYASLGYERRERKGNNYLMVKELTEDDEGARDRDRRGEDQDYQ